MRTCVVQAYGLGNGILTTPLVRALRSMGHNVDMLLDKRRAAWPVFEGWQEIDHMWDQRALDDMVYDVAVFGHPAAYHMELVRHERYLEPRIDPVPGRDYMWWYTKHEVETLVDLARELGYSGETPGLHLPLPGELPNCPPQSVAIGIGYLKQGDKKWEGKHWGNANYIEICKKLIATGRVPTLVGDSEDQRDAEMIVAGAGPGVRNTCGALTCLELFGLVSQCIAYVGNDTGTMHVAAACNIPTVGIFTISNPVKNAPWCTRGQAMERPTPDGLAAQLAEWGLF